MLLARDRKATAEYVESKWRGIGCRYFGAFIVSTAFRAVDRSYNKFTALEHGRLPENINLLLKLGASKIPMTVWNIPEVFVKGSDFYRDIHTLIDQQFNAMHSKTVVHYYAYNKVYQRYDTRHHDYDAYIISHVQQHLANGYDGSPINSYSTLAISEQGNDPRCVYEKRINGSPRCEDRSGQLAESALGLEWRLTTRR
jgi:hypothetical protein